MTVGATGAVATRPRPPVVFAYFATQLTQQALWNTMFHAATTVFWREYSPGLCTALFGFLPIWAYLSRAARRQDLITVRGQITAGAIGALLHAAAVAPVFFERP